MTQPGTLLSIQYLRGLAALGVVVLHLTWFRFPIGAAGVDVFFVISGFIMVAVSDRATSPLTFLRARAIPAVPLAWLAILFALFHTTDNFIRRVLAAMAFWPTLSPNGDWIPMLVQGWTLTYEALLYLAFAAVLLLPLQQCLIALTGGLLAFCATVTLAIPASVTAFGVTPLL